MTVDIPTTAAEDIRRQQMEDPDNKKIIYTPEMLSNAQDVSRWTDRDYLMWRSLPISTRLNLKPSEFVQTPIQHRRFEVLSMNLLMIINK